VSRINLRLSLATTLRRDGSVPAAEIEQAAAEHGISRQELRKVATSLGVETNRNVWRLPHVVVPFTPRGGLVWGITEGEAA